jgi:hypothetical protein
MTVAIFLWAGAYIMDGAHQRFMTGNSAWLADHLIVYAVSQIGSDARNPFRQPVGNVNTPLQTYDFDLRKIGSILNQGASAKAYELHQLNENYGPSGKKVRQVTGSTHPITAYFLPWGDGTTYCGQLGINADYFFTPTLNGCTFAYNGAGPNPSVAHANFVDATTRTDQAAIDADLLGKFGAAAAQTLIKATYKPPVYAHGAMDYRAMVIGIRSGNSWNFYYQNYFVGLNNNTLVHTGVGLCTPI